MALGRERRVNLDEARPSADLIPFHVVFDLCQLGHLGECASADAQVSWGALPFGMK